MISTQPKFENYREWLENKFTMELDEKFETNYDSATLKIKSDIEESEFWKKLISKLEYFNQQYVIDTGYPLFPGPFKLELIIKSYRSFLEKTYRKNIVENVNWPNEPIDGWIRPENWLSKIDDIIRTRFIVKYLDGVEVLISNIKEICDEYHLNHVTNYKAKEEGYYAVHLYVTNTFEIPRMDWNTTEIPVSIELQITTQLQEVIEKLTHKYYEKRRLVLSENRNWQWNYESEEFAPNYLGHILHYIEGMIMDIRKKQEVSKFE